MKKHILLYLLIITGAIFASQPIQAQTYHNVNVTNFEFDPSNLVVNIGDTVVWTNSLGQHNVNGSQVTFPDNPESFKNGVGPEGWTLTVVFTIPGNYGYRCDQHPDLMFGSITVSDTPMSTENITEPELFEFYPNPATKDLHWKWNNDASLANAHIQIYDVTGKLTDSFQLGFDSYKDVSKWTEGMYIYTITSENQPIQTGKLFILK